MIHFDKLVKGMFGIGCIFSNVEDFVWGHEPCRFRRPGDLCFSMLLALAVIVIVVVVVAIAAVIRLLLLMILVISW